VLLIVEPLNAAAAESLRLPVEKVMPQIGP
jgi:hypothetical protein